MAKDPAFLFYSADFMMGTMILTMEERGQYITLLSVMHQQGRLTVEEMENVLHCKLSKKVLEKFLKDSENRFYSDRLETEQKKRKEFSESRRKSLDIDNGDLVHLYLIKDPKKQLYKIGSSKYPYLRIKEVVKYKPGCEFFWISEGLHERFNEKKLHELYAEKREKYDWFYLNSEDLENIVRTFRTVNENENISVIKNINEFEEKTNDRKTEFLTNQKWKEEFCMAKNISMAVLEKLQREFISDTELKDEFVDSYKRYFTNWFNKNHNGTHKQTSSKSSGGKSAGANALLNSLKDDIAGLGQQSNRA